MKNNMKKILILLAVVVSLASCINPHLVVGDEYVVVSVEKKEDHTYGTKYYVTARPVNEGADAGTFNGNVMKYYTNTFYSVGDIIKLSNTTTCIKHGKNETVRERKNC